MIANSSPWGWKRAHDWSKPSFLFFQIGRNPSFQTTCFFSSLARPNHQKDLPKDPHIVSPSLPPPSIVSVNLRARRPHFLRPFSTKHRKPTLSNERPIIYLGRRLSPLPPGATIPVETTHNLWEILWSDVLPSYSSSGSDHDTVMCLGQVGFVVLSPAPPLGSRDLDFFQKI